MKKLVPAFVLSVSLLTPALGQSPPPELSPRDRATEYRTFELLLRQLEDQRDSIDFEIARRREAQYREQEFVEKTSRFVSLWETFAREYNDKKVFNVKVAKEISKAFHDLENSEGWPKAGRR